VAAWGVRRVVGEVPSDSTRDLTGKYHFSELRDYLKLVTGTLGVGALAAAERLKGIPFFGVETAGYYNHARV
jgi:hypothetical protein